MYRNAQQRFATTLDEIRAAGLFKTERVIVSPQGAHIGVIPPGASMPPSASPSSPPSSADAPA